MRNLSVLLAVAAAVTLGAPAATSHAETISLRADYWCPYNCEPRSDKPGYAVEIAREVFARNGHEIDYETLGWARSIADARAGRYAGIIGAIVEDAPDFVFPDEPIAGAGIGYAVRRREGSPYHGPSSLNGRIIGTISGYAFSGETGAYIEANKDDPTKIQLTSGDDALTLNLRKLLAGRVDLVLDDGLVLDYTIADKGLSDRLASGRTGEGGLVHIAFSPALPRSRDYADQLGRGIKELRASGRLAQILARYGLTDWR